MFVTGPPATDDLTEGRGGVRVHRAAARIVDEPTDRALNPTMGRYVADMTAPHGLAVREDLLEQGDGYAYGEMCVPLLTELVAPDRPAELLVLATDVPDVRYGRATATFLSWHCAGKPLAFAVDDQGPLAAFTALHLIDGYARTGGCRRAVLLVAEQPTVFHELAAHTPVPVRAAAAGLVLEVGGSPDHVSDAVPDALSVRRHTDLAEHDVPAALAAEVSGLACDGAPPVVLLGPRLAEVVAGRDLGGDVRECGVDQPFTGVWLELARGLPDWQACGGRVLLAEYDPVRGYLFAAAVRCG